jgi:hypothetical protein
VSHLGDLTADELVMLGHSLRLVPDNAVLTGTSAANFGDDDRILFIVECDAWRRLWAKVAAAISQRDDCEPFRIRKVA